MKVNFSENIIQIDNYTFDSVFRRKRVVKNTDIQFVRIDIDIISIGIDNKEILFIPIENAIEISKFIKKFNICELEGIDVWKLICFKFDENYSLEQDSKNMNILKLLNFGIDEVKNIRKRVSKIITIWSVFAMNNYSINHYDVLLIYKKYFVFKLFYRNFYWESMKIALKGYIV